MWDALRQQPPEPGPEPIPPVPAPTTPIQIEQYFNLPPEVVDKLTPADPGWFTQPIATLCAALIALGAAVLAWRGVQRQIRTSQENQLRELRYEALVGAIDALEATRKAFTARVRGKLPGADHSKDEEIEAGIREVRVMCRVALSKLLVLEMNEAHKALYTTTRSLRKITADSSSVEDVAVLKTLQDDIDWAVSIFQADLRAVYITPPKGEIAKIIDKVRVATSKITIIPKRSSSPEADGESANPTQDDTPVDIPAEDNGKAQPASQNGEENDTNANEPKPDNRAPTEDPASA